MLPDDGVALDLADEEPLDADLVRGDRPPVAVHPGHVPVLTQLVDATSALFVLILTQGSGLDRPVVLATHGNRKCKKHITIISLCTETSN